MITIHPAETAPSPAMAAALTAQLLRIGARFNNADMPTIRLAVAALVSGKAAFWSSASYSHAPVGALIYEANRLGDLAAAIGECNAMSGMGHNYGKLEWLDHLIPLNELAVADLLDAYVERKTFRSASELFARADRAGFEMAEVA